jgi:hypothetical protein
MAHVQPHVLRPPAHVQPRVPKAPPDFEPEVVPRREALQVARDLIHEGYPPKLVFDTLQKIRCEELHARIDVYLACKQDMDVLLDERGILPPEWFSD